MQKIIHIDMDCFYAAVEMRDFPQLANKAVAVGGQSDRRGVISACNYEARRFGIHSAMSSAKAFRLCPELILQPVRMEAYRAESQKIRAIFAKYTDLIEPLSLDEAYIDVSECPQFYGSATLIAQAIRYEIYQKTQLTASAGIAPTKSLAKIASDWHKPNGQKVITPAEIEPFMLGLPVRKLFGVGPRMEEKLKNLNISTCQELQTISKHELSRKFGSFGARLYDLCRGIDNRCVNPDRVRKSISVETTYAEDKNTLAAMSTQLPLLRDKLEQRIQRHDEVIIISSIFVKLKFNDFSQTTAEEKAEQLSHSKLQQLLETAWQRKQLPVRLIGIGLRLAQEKEHSSATQLTLPGLE